MRFLVVIATAAAMRLGRPTAPRDVCEGRASAAAKGGAPRALAALRCGRGLERDIDTRGPLRSRGPCVLDVGFGHGESLAGMAARRPDKLPGVRSIGRAWRRP